MQLPRRNDAWRWSARRRHRRELVETVAQPRRLATRQLGLELVVCAAPQRRRPLEDALARGRERQEPATGIRRIDGDGDELATLEELQRRGERRTIHDQ